MRVAPVAACAVKKHRRQQPRVHRNSRHSLRNGFNGFLRALPGDHAWLPPSSARRVSVFANLAPASERQDHTTSPSAQTPLVAQALRPGDVRPSHPAPNVRDDREPPLLWVRDGREHRFDLPDGAMPGTCDTLARRAESAWVVCDSAACRFARAFLPLRSPAFRQRCPTLSHQPGDFI
jgi:hypothetical protein